MLYRGWNRPNLLNGERCDRIRQKIREKIILRAFHFYQASEADITTLLWPVFSDSIFPCCGAANILPYFQIRSDELWLRWDTARVISYLTIVRLSVMCFDQTHRQVCWVFLSTICPLDFLLRVWLSRNFNKCHGTKAGAGPYLNGCFALSWV